MGVMRVGTRLRQGCSDVFRRDTCVSLLKAAISLQECVASEHGWKTCGYCRKPYDELSADTGVSGLAHASDGSISNVSLGRSFARSTNPISSVRAIASYNISNVRCFSTGLGRGFIDDDRDIDDTGDNDFESAQALDNSNSIEDVQIALEHAMVEAYRLLQEDKVELAELLVTEGLVAAESVLDTRDPALARIWDQAALLQFFLGRFREAERNCLKSLQAAKSLEEEEGRNIAVAMCQLRLGTIYLGLDRRKDGNLLLQDASSLLSNLGSEFEPVHEIAYYKHLLELPGTLLPTHLERIEDALLELSLQALKGMQETPTVGPHLLRAAFREHRALMDRAVEKSDWALAEAILLQAIKFQEELCPESDELALTTYQYGTLEYVRGHHDKAMQICQDSLKLARRLYKKESHSQIALRRHRIGTIQLAAGEFLDATETLTTCSRHLARTAGEANPLTGESMCALSLARLAQIQANRDIDAYNRVLAPKHREEQLSAAREGLMHMHRGFGQAHMLVKKMTSLHEKIASE